MSTAREQYRITIHPTAGANGPDRMTKYVIDRWMPNNAGGVMILAGPALLGLLRPMFDKAKFTGKDVVIDVNTLGITPVLTEVP